MLPIKEKAKVNMINLAPYNREGQKLELIHYVTNGDGLNLQHLYIVSDDKIEEGDWVIINGKLIRQCSKTVNENGFIEVSGFNAVLENACKKIIATTDTSLITCQCKKVGYHKLSCKQTYNLPEPSQGFTKVFIEEYNKGNVITEVMVEYEKNEPNPQTISKEFDFDDVSFDLKINPKDNTITIKKLKDSWNKCEHAANLIKYRQDYEQFKKDSHFGPNQREIEEWSNKWIEENL